MKLVSRLKRSLRLFKHRVEDRQTYRFYNRQFKRYLEMHHIPDTRVEGEEDYVRVWKTLTSRVDTTSYRFFSRFMGNNPYIIPEDIGDSVIEYYLNPLSYRSFYADKNLYAQYLTPVDAMPKDLLRRMDGEKILDFRYNLTSLNSQSGKYEFGKAIADHDTIVIKPAANSCSGNAVNLFSRITEDDGSSYFKDRDGQVLDGNYLLHYNFGKSFIIQEAIVQHPYLAQFCSTSVNTLRMCVYKSVIDEEIILFAAALRIGHEGSIVDNLHAGGGFVKVDPKTGKLGHNVYDQYGMTTNTLNGIDFSRGFQIPCWDRIVSFARMISHQIHHMRLLALDVSLDVNEKPRLIEFNIKEFAFWIPMFSGQQVFGDRIDEVIGYCRRRLIDDQRIKK